MLIEFSGTVSDVVHADGGRVVKFIGDEVMWVGSTPAQLVQVAVDLVEHPRAREAGLQVRAGLGYGSVLAIGGDYFGNTVNLAARLVAAAASRTDPGFHRRSRRAARLAGDPAESVDTQGFRRPGDGLRPAPVPLMVDLDALEAAGLANARERAALIEYLDGLGFTAEEMVEAERRGRLFGLSGDAVRRSGRPTHSLRTAAEALGAASGGRRALLGHAWLDRPEPRRRRAEPSGRRRPGRVRST